MSLPRHDHAALRDTQRAVYWLDRPELTHCERERVIGDITCDLLVVGGGYTGLWAALQALERDPSRSVVVIEGDTVAYGASGRNGGFCDASITHGIGNGLAHFPNEMETLLRLGRENFEGIRESLHRHNIAAAFEATGQVAVATQPWQVEGLREEFNELTSHGETAVLLDRDEMQNAIASPTFLGGVWQQSNIAIVDPAKLCIGLADAVEALGGRIYERSTCDALEARGAMIKATTPAGSVQASKVVLATNAFRGLLPSMRRRVVPVWDYVLMTEPLSAAQLASIGWSQRQGLSDTANLFHYSRLTADNRILWGGYDAIYHFGGKTDVQRYEQRDATFNLLAHQFFDTFPQLDGLPFSHRWGGPIATTSRFCVTFGTGFAGRVAYAVGYTGLGVGASRFGARVALDLLDAPSSEIHKLDFVRRAPFPFPPEPFRSIGIHLTRHSIARSDANEGRRNLWLKLLDRCGVGFDS